jgi:RHS repeat-associated protein
LSTRDADIWLTERFAAICLDLNSVNQGNVPDPETGEPPPPDNDHCPTWEIERQYLQSQIDGDILGVIDYFADGSRQTTRFGYSMFGLPRLLPTNTVPGSAFGGDLDNDDNINNGLHPDGQSDISDLIAFLIMFENGDPRGDLANATGHPIPDGGTDVSDLVYMLQQFQGGLSVTAEPVRFAWRAYQWDGRLNLYHVRHRTFDPKLITWLQPDPLGEVDGLNVYAYVGWDPFNKIDPMGLWGVGDYFANLWEGIKSVVLLDPGGARTNWSTSNEIDRQTRQRNNFEWKNPGSDSSMEMEQAAIRNRCDDFAAKASLAAGAVDAAVRAAFPVGDAIDAAAAGLDHFIDDPSLHTAGVLVLFLLDSKAGKSAAKAEKLITVRFVNKQTEKVVHQVRYRGVQFEAHLVLKLEKLDIDLNRKDAQGRTNKQRMEAGLAPYDRQGRKLELHHHQQDPSGPLIEMPARLHDDVDHPESPTRIDRPEFRDIREQWWQDRLRDLER